MSSPVNFNIKLSVVSVGSFSDASLLTTTLGQEPFDVLVSGSRLGADLLAEEFAVHREMQIQFFLPEYRKYGKAAYRLRNELIILNSDKVIVFWDGIARYPLIAIQNIKEMGKNFRTILY